MQIFDVIVIGAGAAGMMCAMQAGRRGRRIILLEHASVIGKKLRISGGGRCNFTNLNAGPEHYVSANPDFCRSALSRYTPEDFIALVRAHGIAFHEKTLGQLFCDHSAQQIIDMLVEQCRTAGVTMRLDCRVRTVEKTHHFIAKTTQGDYAAPSLVIATGGLSLPKAGATDFGYRIAKQFGLRIIETAPALDAFVFAAQDAQCFEGLAGVSMPAIVSCNGASFREAILLTHTGLSGPAALQASLYWRSGDMVHVDLLPETTLEALMRWFAQQQSSGSRAEIKTLLAERVPQRIAERFCELHRVTKKPLAQQSAEAITALCRGLKDWRFTPRSTVGYRTAEVTRGGVDTRELSSKTMESHKVPGLYFIGEVVDVTGWLGGYNFQWAWASGWAAGQAV
ncbi:MAG: NAD(P)/FAD-dependent oxidoreductase [Candidatus Omnitrophica bacterium]|nr:NAD(P)/FAD-dependent oxidoreductase [Candidatus Omnitrophota bacterium]